MELLIGKRGRGLLCLAYLELCPDCIFYPYIEYKIFNRFFLIPVEKISKACLVLEDEV